MASFLFGRIINFIHPSRPIEWRPVNLRLTIKFKQKIKGFILTLLPPDIRSKKSAFLEVVSTYDCSQAGPLSFSSLPSMSSLITWDWCCIFFVVTCTEPQNMYRKVQITQCLKIFSFHNYYNHVLDHAHPNKPTEILSFHPALFFPLITLHIDGSRYFQCLPSPPKLHFA